MKTLVLVILGVMLIGLTACAPASPNDTIQAKGPVLQSDRRREPSPVVTPDIMSSLSDGNGAFAFDLYKILSEKDGNIFYSPYSISSALAMTYAGARGETEKQMAETMGFTLPQSQLHPAFNTLDHELTSRGKGAQGKDDEGFRLNIVNAIWGQKDYSFLASYMDTLAENYGAGLRILDFAHEPEPSRITINDWVSERTEDRIKDLIPEGVINQATRLVLTNAIYFNAAWQYPFTEGATSPGIFTLLNGDETRVPMMQQQNPFLYTRGDGYRALELPYDGQELSMVILLPNSGEFGEFEDSIDHKQVKDIIARLERQEVRLTMPRFEYDFDTGLKDVLSTLGMRIAFTSDANFSGMDGTRDLFIQDVLHKAFVSVDEVGTEAAAATAVMVGLTAMPPEPVEVAIDRPFIFIIRDIETSSILFVGRIFNPAMN